MLDRVTSGSARGLLGWVVRVQEHVKLVCQDCGLVDEGEGSAVVDPHELGVLEVVGESFGVGGGHELVMACPDDEDRAGERALLIGSLEQLLGLGTLRRYLVRLRRTLGLWRSGWIQLLRSSGTRRLDRAPKVAGRWRI